MAPLQAEPYSLSGLVRLVFLALFFLFAKLPSSGESDSGKPCSEK